MNPKGTNLMKLLAYRNTVTQTLAHTFLQDCIPDNIEAKLYADVTLSMSCYKMLKLKDKTLCRFY